MGLAKLPFTLWLKLMHSWLEQSPFSENVTIHAAIFIHAFCEKANLTLQKCEQINDLGITVNAAFTPSANVLAAANKVRGILYFKKTSFNCFTNEIFVPLYSALVLPHLEYAFQADYLFLKKDINRLEIIQRAATRCVKGLWGLTYEERLKAIKLQPLE